MSLRTRGLVLAMEGEEEVVPSTSEEVSDSLSELSDSADEASEVVGNVVELEGSVDDAVQDAETLEKIQGVMEDSVESGEGLDETSAEIAEIAVEAICARLGIKKRAMPAMESFGSQNSRVVATKIAIEGISGMVKTTWEAIVKAWNTMWTYIKDFFTKYFTALGRAKETQAKLATAVKEFGKTEVGEKKEIENSSLSSAFAIGGKADAGTVETILKNHTEYTNSLIVAAEVLKDGVKSVKPGETPSTAEVTSKYVNKVSAVSPDLVGGAVLKVEKSAEEGKGFTFSFSFGGEKAKEIKLPVLTKDEMGKVLAGVNSLLTVSDNFKKEMKTIEEINKAVIDLAKAFGNMRTVVKDEGSTDEEKEAAKKSSKAAAEFIKSVQSAINKTTTTVPGLNLKAANAAMNYVQSSMKAYK